MSDSVKLNSQDWTTKTTERSRGRMKIAFKLNKEEATAFKNWSGMVKPEKVDDEMFVKQIFFRGIEALNEMLTQAAQEVMNDPATKEKLKEQGIDLSKMSVTEDETAPVAAPENPIYTPKVETQTPIYDIKTRQEIKQ